MKGRAITLRRAWAGKHFTALFIPNVLAVNLFNISTKCAGF